MYSLEAKKESREFHTLIGGRRRIDLSLWDRQIAEKIRKYVTEQVIAGQTVSGLAKLLGTSQGTLSKAMAGTAGEERMIKINDGLQNGIVDKSSLLT